jgi:hypothetical protein
MAIDRRRFPPDSKRTYTGVAAGIEELLSYDSPVPRGMASPGYGLNELSNGNPLSAKTPISPQGEGSHAFSDSPSRSGYLGRSLMAQGPVEPSRDI